MLNVVILSVVMLSVVAPMYQLIMPHEMFYSRGPSVKVLKEVNQL